jgi:hypothetical protein
MQPLSLVRLFFGPLVAHIPIVWVVLCSTPLWLRMAFSAGTQESALSILKQLRAWSGDVVTRAHGSQPPALVRRRPTRNQRGRG